MTCTTSSLKPAHFPDVYKRQSENNARAIAFYRRSGFVQLGRDPGVRERLLLTGQMCIRDRGSTMTWIGAMCGGSTRPLLSPWVMIRPPMMRVDIPHEVWCG